MSNDKQNGRCGQALMAGLLTTFIGSMALAQAVPEAPKAKANDNACVFSGTINNWRALDANNLIIWAPSRKDAYHVTLGFPLHDLKGREDLAIIDRNGDGRLCGYGMDQIVIAGGFSPEKSTITGMTKLDEAGLAALGEQYKIQLVPKVKDRPVK